MVAQFTNSVIWYFLYSTSSARDHATLFSARNFLNARGVSKEPMKNINAATELLDNYTDALIIAATLEFFGMNTIEDQPKEHTFHMMNMDPYVYVNDTMKTLVKKFAIHEGPELRTVQIKCDTCGKEYRRVATLRKHIREKHEGTMAHQSADKDAIFNYSCGALSLCLVLRNFVDA
ncbi:hypothetical protein HOLleu_00653 [Holothuria leucospilota]|uniref:C2H2-type domain-containing protein n=1 Tax=Holothuria leucospilota TaxID=206669 RepID=A0A9Q1CNX7_HOLLE|nr:hypothetical protein HOLleu_00653 [Holothuria leucospilota]